MIIVSGMFEIAEEDAERAVAAAITMAAASNAEEGCISYAFYRDLETPNRFRVFEEWVDREALRAHFETPHMATFREQLGQIRILGRDVKEYEVAGVQPLG